MLALLNEFVYEYRGNNTCVIQEKTALNQSQESRIVKIKAVTSFSTAPKNNGAPEIGMNPMF